MDTDSVHASAEAALAQVDQLARFRQLDSHTGWPTRMGFPGALSYQLVNLSERRFGARMDADRARKDAIGARMDADRARIGF